MSRAAWPTIHSLSRLTKLPRYRYGVAEEESAPLQQAYLSSFSNNRPRRSREHSSIAPSGSRNFATASSSGTPASSSSSASAPPPTPAQKPSRAEIRASRTPGTGGSAPNVAGSSSASPSTSQLQPRGASGSSSAGTSGSSGGARIDSSNQAPVPPLPRPLGVPKQPTSTPKSWAQKKEEMLSEERHKAKRKELIKEATQGYFHDYNRARTSHGGKLWIAPPVLIREDRALYFPDVSGKSLLGENVHTTDLLKGKISLLSITTTRISEEHVHSFVAPLLPDWTTPSAHSSTHSHPQPPAPAPTPSPSSPSSEPISPPGTNPSTTLSPHPSTSTGVSASNHHLFQHVQINHQENPLKSMLLSFFVSSLKRTINKADWGRYIISGGGWSHFDIEGPLGLENKLVGYVFLIDQNIKVRWAGCGPATDKEVQDLRTATAVLMRRAGEKAQA